VVGTCPNDLSHGITFQSVTQPTMKGMGDFMKLIQHVTDN
jgi:hypothetical protein